MKKEYVKPVAEQISFQAQEAIMDVIIGDEPEISIGGGKLPVL